MYGNYFDSQVMRVNGLTASINLPPAPEGGGVHVLPPYSPQAVYVVDEYECPANWMHGSAKAASYFLPVWKDKHLWFGLSTAFGVMTITSLSS